MALRIVEKLGQRESADATLTLPFHLRQRSRLLTRLDSGDQVGLVLPRGGVLRHEDLLRMEDGRVVQIIAASEDVSTASSENPLVLARACYHLGNRHVALQIGDCWLRYLHDNVLDTLVRSLGLTVIRERAPFEPEAGAHDARHHHGQGHDAE